MSLFGLFSKVSGPVPLIEQLWTYNVQSTDPQLKTGDHILIELGRDKTPVYLFFQDIPVDAKLLIDLNKLPPPKRRITLPTVAKFMWDKYHECIKHHYELEKVVTFTWGQLFLLAHTTKVVQDERSHFLSLDALLGKGESVNYQIEGMFTMNDWQLVRNTVKVGEAKDNSTRNTIRKLFQRCPLLYDHMMIEHGATKQELHEIGLTYADTHEEKWTKIGDGIEELVQFNVYGRPPRPTAGPPQDRDVPDVVGHGDEKLSDLKDDDRDVAPVSSLEGHDSVHEKEDLTDNNRNLPGLEDGDRVVTPVSSLEGHDIVPEQGDPVDEDGNLSDPEDDEWDEFLKNSLEAFNVVPEQEDLVNDVDDDGNLPDLEDDDWDVALVPNSAVYDVVPEKEDLVNDQSTIANVHSQPAENLADQLAGLAVQEAVIVGKGRNETVYQSESLVEEASTEFVNALTDLKHGDQSDVGDGNENDVTALFMGQSEEECAHAPEQQHQFLSEHQSHVDLLEAATDPQSDVTEANHPEDVQKAKEASDEESTSDAGNVDEAERVSDLKKVAQEYTAGFIPTHELPRTTPVTPVESEMSAADSNASSEADTEEFRPNGKRAPREHDIQNRVTKHSGDERPHKRVKLAPVRRKINEPAMKYGNSVLHMLRKKQAALSTNPKGIENVGREEPVRQPKGPPASGKEMADDKAKDPKAWEENFAVGAPASKATAVKVENSEKQSRADDEDE